MSKLTTEGIRSHNFHKFWLKITAIVVGAFGPIFFLGTMTATMEPARWTLDFLSWPLDGVTTYASPDTRFYQPYRRISCGLGGNDMVPIRMGL